MRFCDDDHHNKLKSREEEIWLHNHNIFKWPSPWSLPITLIYRLSILVDMSLRAFLWNIELIDLNLYFRSSNVALSEIRHKGNLFIDVFSPVFCVLIASFFQRIDCRYVSSYALSAISNLPLP